MIRSNVIQHQLTQGGPRVGELYDDYDPTDKKGTKKNTSSTGYFKRRSKQQSEDMEELIGNIQAQPQDQTELEITVSHVISQYSCRQ